MLELALPLLYAVAGILLILEHLRPAHITTLSWAWYLRAGLINALLLLVYISFEWLWASNSFFSSVFTLPASMPDYIAALLAYFIFTFIVYWWHRLRHHSKIIWRIFHQLHHSPKRIQTLTAYYIHPLDLIANLVISNSIMFLLLGVNLEVAAWYTLITGSAGFLIHANIRLPRQVGYVFQTPEMHRLHHQSGHHAHNYSDIVIWDMIFGTYHNPIEPITSCGFEEQYENKIIPMLLGINIFKNKK